VADLKQRPWQISPGMSRKATKDIIGRVYEIKQKNGSLLQVAMLSSATYSADKKKILLCFDPRIKPYLLELKREYTIYYLENVLGLKSIYSIRLYELLKQYESIGVRTFDVEQLRFILKIENEYKLYADFKRNVILSSQKELMEKTDIYFDFAEQKSGNKVQKLVFSIHKKAEAIQREKAKKMDKLLNLLSTDVEKYDELRFKTEQIYKVQLLSEIKPDDPKPDLSYETLLRMKMLEVAIEEKLV
jgi:plasmid replication initiation protein